jgi:4,5-dihydroxyphthalate decarboxylase
MTDQAPVRLKTLLADYPGTKALKSGSLRSDMVTFDFAEVSRANKGFKRVVRDLEFDFAELAITTFLMAKAYGKPLVLMPAVIVGRFQHPYIIYNSERGHLNPGDLAGRRVGIRAYSVTTAMWIRGILANDYGVDLNKVQWITFEEPHVAEYRDPVTATRAAAGKDPVEMLLNGELDAAVVGDGVPSDPRLKTLIPDPAAAAQDWYQRNGAVQINHMMVVKQSVVDSNPEIVEEVFRLLKESKQAAAIPGERDDTPFGVEANRQNLEVAIEYVYQQGLIPVRFTVDELFNDVTRKLGK